MSNKTKVKSYVRKGRIVKSYDRTIKDALLVGGAGLGAAIGAKKGGLRGALIGTALGSLPGAFAPENKQDGKKYALGLGAVGALAGGALALKYGKNLLPKTKALVPYNPTVADRNLLVAIGINANKQVKNLPKSVMELDMSLYGKFGAAKVSEINKSIMDFSQKSTTPGLLRNKADMLKAFDETLIPEAKEYIIAKSRLLNSQGLDKGTDIREQLYKAVLDDVDSVYNSDAKALKNYRAIIKAMNDPKIGVAEKAAYQAQLKKFGDKFTSKPIIDRLRSIGFQDIDIKEMKNRVGSDGLFSNRIHLAEFARKKGSRDKKKRKINRNLVYGLAIGGGLLAGAAGLKISEALENRAIRKTFEKQTPIMNKKIDDLKEALKANREEFDTNLQEAISKRSQERINNLPKPNYVNDLARLEDLKTRGNLKAQGIVGKQAKSDIITRRRNEIRSLYRKEHPVKLRAIDNENLVSHKRTKLDNLLNWNKKNTKLSKSSSKRFSNIVKNLSQRVRKNKGNNPLLNAYYSVPKNNLTTFARKPGSKDKSPRKRSKIGALLRTAALPTVGVIGGTLIGGNLAKRVALRHMGSMEPVQAALISKIPGGIGGALGAYVGYKALGELNKATINRDMLGTPMSKDKKYRIDKKQQLTPEKALRNQLTNPFNYLLA